MPTSPSGPFRGGERRGPEKSWELPGGAELGGEEHGGDGRQVLFRTKDGKAIAMSVRGADTALELGTMISARLGLPEGQHRLFLEGTQLEDGHYLADHNIQKDDCLQMAPRLRGRTGDRGAG